jgi:hypothetical protein
MISRAVFVLDRCFANSSAMLIIDKGQLLR